MWLIGNWNVGRDKWVGYEIVKGVVYGHIIIIIIYCYDQ